VIDVMVTREMRAAPDRVRAVMFEPRNDPRWMAAVTSVEPQGDSSSPGARVRRVGRFLGRELRWTTELVSASDAHVDLRIIDGPMRGTVRYEITPSAGGSTVSIRNVGEAPGFAPALLLKFFMRRSLDADLRRLQALVEQAR
jgi:uncharacterized membrane protein